MPGFKRGRPLLTEHEYYFAQLLWKQNNAEKRLEIDRKFRRVASNRWHSAAWKKLKGVRNGSVIVDPQLAPYEGNRVSVHDGTHKIFMIQELEGPDFDDLGLGDLDGNT